MHLHGCQGCRAPPHDVAVFCLPLGNDPVSHGTERSQGEYPDCCYGLSHDEDPGHVAGESVRSRGGTTGVATGSLDVKCHPCPRLVCWDTCSSAGGAVSEGCGTFRRWVTGGGWASGFPV